MDERQFHHMLKQTLNEEIQNVELWKQIEANLPTVRTGFRLGKVVLIAILLAMSAVAAYALYQGEVIPGDPGITSVEQANLLTYFDETHSIEGEFAENKLTVTLDYAYADANRITIGYTVRGESPTGERMMAYSNPTLMTADGQPIDRLLLQANQEEQTPPEEGSTGAFGMKLTTNFIASDFDLADGEMLNLRLIVEVALSYLDSGEFPAPGMMMAGITEFNFSVPFISGTVMEVTQSAEVSQKMVELQRVVLTPSMTRLDMCYQLPAVTQLPGWSPFMILSVDEQPVFTGQTETYGIGDRYDLNSPCRSVIVPLPLATHTGEWQVEIVEFRDLGSFTATVAGPWVFTFSFPEN